MTTRIIDKKDGTIYANLTCRYLITSMDGKQAISIMYDWTTTAILAKTITYAKAETIVECFEQNIKYLAKRGFKPVCNVINNVATNAIKTYLESEKIKVQFVTTCDHRVIATKRAIQTFKNHTISGLCVCDKEFLSILWCKIIKQAQDTLNMLRTSQIHPKLSTFRVLEDHYDFNKVPFRPLGTRATISPISMPRKSPTEDNNGQIRAHCRNQDQRNKKNAKRAK